MSDETDKGRREDDTQAFDSLAAATAVGFAVASRTMEMWFGMMSGFARASREMMTPASREAAPQAGKHEASVIAFAPRPGKAPAKATSKEGAPLKAGPAGAEKRQPAAIEKPAEADDLKRIAGIGPKLEQVLNGFGVWTHAQIAALQVEEIAWLDDALGLNGRIDGDDWLGQAAALARPGAKNKDAAAG